jgi:plasmid maintenance system antidote protein VapI
MGRIVRQTDRDPEHLTTGQRLSWLMRDRGVTAKGLAANLRIQESTLGNFRGGYRSIPSDVVAGMARELKTNVDFLLERSEDARPGAVIEEEAHTRMEARRSG